MIYLYDNAIVDDLKRSFNPNNVKDPVVKVIDPEEVIGLAAQIQNDDVKFPIVALTRVPDSGVDTALTNFTRMHRGVQAVLDPDTNELFYERAIPIKLSYKLTLLATNTADIDELERELIFKYTDMYFLTLTLPYECKRQVRFGVVVDKENATERSSANLDYIQTGKLYQSIISLNCEGCVLVHYTPAKIKRSVAEVDIHN